MKNVVCCFIGHRIIEKEIETYLKNRLEIIIKSLITKNNVNTFMFGSKSQFNNLCYDIVTKTMKEYPYIKRVYVRAEYPYIDNDYKEYLLSKYEETYYPDNVIGTGKLVYIKRNYDMINNSDICLFYYDDNNSKVNSGTKIALNYANKHNKKIIQIK